MLCSEPVGSAHCSSSSLFTPCLLPGMPPQCHLSPGLHISAVFQVIATSLISPINPFLTNLPQSGLICSFKHLLDAGMHQKTWFGGTHRVSMYTTHEYKIFGLSVNVYVNLNYAISFLKDRATNSTFW